MLNQIDHQLVTARYNGHSKGLSLTYHLLGIKMFSREQQTTEGNPNVRMR